MFSELQSQRLNNKLTDKTEITYHSDKKIGVVCSAHRDQCLKKCLQGYPRKFALTIDRFFTTSDNSH